MINDRQTYKLLISLVCNVFGVCLLAALWTQTTPSQIALSKWSSHASPIQILPHNGRTLLSIDEKDWLSSSWTPPAPSKQLDIKHDLSLNQSFQITEHENQWQYCKLDLDTETIPFCTQSVDVEQSYQQTWTGKTFRIPFYKRKVPQYLACAHLPPPRYQWPNKASIHSVHWDNLRLNNQTQSITDPWFDISTSDANTLAELDWAARFIPFGPKIRLMLSLGADSSLFHLLKHRYDVQTINAVIPNGPRCELISERGGLCMLIDMFEPMPFSKFSFDAIHIGSVYDSQHPDVLLVVFNEIHRLVRPGGYLWLHSGWSRDQLATLRGLLITKLGYQVLYQQERPASAKQQGFIVREVEWDAVLVKPISASKSKSCTKSFPSKFSFIAETEKHTPLPRTHHPVEWID